MPIDNCTAPTAEPYNAIVPKTKSFSGTGGSDVPLAVDGKNIDKSVHNTQGFLDFLNVFMYLDGTPRAPIQYKDAVLPV